MCRLNTVMREVKIAKKEAIYGYRWFKVKVSNKLHRFSVGPVHFKKVENPWKKKIAKADTAPRKWDKKGLYAYSNKRAALLDKPNFFGNEVAILARVRLWGKCVQHKDGFRSEFAEIVAFYPEKDARVTHFEPNGGSKDVLIKPLINNNTLFKEVPLCKLNEHRTLKAKI